MMLLSEDNVRLTLLTVVLCLYIFAGALIIQSIESPTEEYLMERYRNLYSKFANDLANGSADIDQLQQLLYVHGNLSSQGLLHGSKRWDLLGSIHFVSTIVTTIGYGSYTPATGAGKIFVILYGFLGCSGGILFLNLLLERIITWLALFLRILHVKNVVRKGQTEMLELERWKPSVYSVMACLTVMSLAVSLLSIATYSFMEEWTFLEAAYYAFVSFSTIGFGDFVSVQRDDYPLHGLYVLLDVILLVAGCSCLYSLFNVISILLKQLLNWTICRLDYQYLFKAKDQPDKVLRKYSLKAQRERDRRRKSSITLQKVLRKSRTPFYVDNGRASICNNTLTGPATASHAGGPCDEFSSAADRKLSDGLISLKDFLTSNQVSLALMQKELYEAAQTRRDGGGGIPVRESTTRFIPGTIGPLAMLCNKLG